MMKPETDEINELQILSDNQLESMLMSNTDFKTFISIKKSEFNEGTLIIETLPENEKEALSEMYKTYSGYEDLMNNSGKEDKALFEKITPISNASEYLTRVIESLNKYSYNRDTFMEVISNNLKLSEDDKNLRTKEICDDIRSDVYVTELVNYYYEGWSFEDADRAASTAASWAYVGCVRAIYN